MKLNLPPRSCAAVFAAAVASTPVAAHAMGDEEFVGPFPSWANVKTNYGAVGDGVTDDTAAIQKALNALGPNNPTLYLPAGSYRITQTLTIAARQYVNVLGQDPANTTIIWAGSSGGTMLRLNGIAYSRFDRLGFNGQGDAAIGIDQSWDNSTGFFDTGNEYADDVFKNAGVGLRCGNLGFGCAETAMLRNQFLNNTVAGVAMKNFNALDMFIWYSTFQNNATGISNNPGAGNFHVYDSIFQNSTSSDIAIGNTGVFNFRNNYSLGSEQFINAGGTNNPANITIQGNSILDTKRTESISVRNLGPVVLLDNKIRSGGSVSSGPVVKAAGFNPTGLFSMGNTFTVSSPTYGSGHYYSIADQVVARSTINPSLPVLPGTPSNNHRQIFEVTPGSSAAQMQQVINMAAAAESAKPVVHIQPGSYTIDATLVVPAGNDMQIIGDGWHSRLIWSGSTTGPVIWLQGPSKATLRDFSVSGEHNSADGIEVDNADQPGSRIFMEQSILGSSHANLVVDGLDHTNVELHDFYHQYDASAGMTSVVVTGGPSAGQGLWKGGATNIFAGASAGNYISYGVSNGAHVALRDIWYDAGAGGNLVAKMTGTGSFTYAGSALYLAGTSRRAISLDNFQGTAAFLNLNTNGGIEVTGNGANAQVLGLGLVGPSAKLLTNSSDPAAITASVIGQTTGSHPLGAATSDVPEQGKIDGLFLIATLDQARKQQPTVVAPLPNGVTDTRFYRVFVESAEIGIHLKAAADASPRQP